MSKRHRLPTWVLAWSGTVISVYTYTKNLSHLCPRFFLNLSLQLLKPAQTLSLSLYSPKVLTLCCSVCAFVLCELFWPNCLQFVCNYYDYAWKSLELLWGIWELRSVCGYLKRITQFTLLVWVFKSVARFFVFIDFSVYLCIQIGDLFSSMHELGKSDAKKDKIFLSTIVSMQAPVLVCHSWLEFMLLFQ